MTTVLVVAVEAAAFVAVVATLVRMMRAQERAHARREDMLLNQLLHAAGHPWQEAPAVTARHDRANGNGGGDRGWTPTPEQMPLT